MFCQSRFGQSDSRECLARPISVETVIAATCSTSKSKTIVHGSLETWVLDAVAESLFFSKACDHFYFKVKVIFKVKYEARVSVFLPRGGRLDIGRLRRREGQEEVRQEVEKDRDRWPEAARVQDVRFGDAQVPRLPIRP